ncbi:Uncharacterised protein [Acinetobacter baumannii]|nr:Uncharacterised protein [Acinetobacter baumannii]
MADAIVDQPRLNEEQPHRAAHGVRGSAEQRAEIGNVAEPGYLALALAQFVAVDAADQQALAMAHAGDGIDHRAVDRGDLVQAGAVGFLAAVLDVQAEADLRRIAESHHSWRHFQHGAVGDRLQLGHPLARDPHIVGFALVEHRLGILLGQQGRPGSDLRLPLALQQGDLGQQEIQPATVHQAADRPVTGAAALLAILAGGADLDRLVVAQANPGAPVDAQLGEVLGIDVDDRQADLDPRRGPVEGFDQAAIHGQPVLVVAHHHRVQRRFRLDHRMARLRSRAQLARLVAHRNHVGIAEHPREDTGDARRLDLVVAVLDLAVLGDRIAQREDLHAEVAGLFAAQGVLLLQHLGGLLDQFEIAPRTGHVHQSPGRVGTPAEARLPDTGGGQRALQLGLADLLQPHQPRLHLGGLEYVQHGAVVVPAEVVEGGHQLQEGLRAFQVEATADLVVDLVADDHRGIVVGAEVGQHVAQAFALRHIVVRQAGPVQRLRAQDRARQQRQQSADQQAAHQGRHTGACGGNPRGSGSSSGASASSSPTWAARARSSRSGSRPSRPSRACNSRRPSASRTMAWG